MEEAARVTLRTVEGVFHDFKGRRAGLIKALTSDAEKFFQRCDPEKDNLYLFGLQNEAWEVNLPVDLVPPELPEPTSGINIARDEMNKRDWLLMVAAQSDSWLLALAFFFCGLIGFDKNERKELFQMINELPTIYEVVKADAKSSSMAGERDEDDFSGVTCGACKTNKYPDQLWICCDVCEIWFHAGCVKIAHAKAEYLKEFKCPDCTTSNRIELQ